MNPQPKKVSSKSHSRPQKHSGIILKQPIIPFNSDDPSRNKITFINSQMQPSPTLNPILNSSNRQKENEKILLDANPVIVTRRNISTAQTKNHYYQDDEEDLILTSTCMKKKEPEKYVSHFGQTVKESFKKGAERPQSKQEPRAKGWSNSQMLIKSSVMQNDRPQTSKGQRPKNLQSSTVTSASKRKASLGNQQSKNVNMNEELTDSLAHKKGIKTSRLLFKTSIDAEFLSLFAN